MRFRLIKPIWGKKTLGKKKKPNPEFVRQIKGLDVLEGDERDFSNEFLSQKNEEGYNIYFFPNGSSKRLPEGHWLSGKEVDEFNFVYVDMDLKDRIYKTKEEFIERVKKFPLKPSWALDSGNGIHVYWAIDDADRETFMVIQKMLIKYFDTDTSVWTPLQLMRFPGFYNTKQADNFKLADYVDELMSDQRYSADQFLQALPKLDEKDFTDIERHTAKLEGRDVMVGFEEDMLNELPAKFLKLIEKKPYIGEIFYHPEKTHGDRSEADYNLACLLCENDIDREQALAVMLQTKKAQSRTGHSRFTYANDTLDKAYLKNTGDAALSVEELLSNPDPDADLGDLVNGPYFLDRLDSRWRKRQMLGLIAGAGIGKTSFTLKIFKEFIRNNPANEDIFFFFSLEMTRGEILKRWKRIVRNDPTFYKRLYIVDMNFFQKDEEEAGPNLQRIYKIVRDTEKRTGKKVGVVAIDHLDVVEGDVDTRIKPHFNAKMSKYVEKKLGRDIVILNKDGLCQKFKYLAQKLNCFLILQSQTTKEKDGGGDLPIGKNAAFGTSKFEWYCDYVVGVWRPLQRVMDHCKSSGLYVTAFQYNKMREQNPDEDELALGQHYMVKFLPKYEDFVDLTEEEKQTVDELVEKANKLRQVEDKKQSSKYYRAPIQRLRAIVGGKAKGKKDE